MISADFSDGINRILSFLVLPSLAGGLTHAVGFEGIWITQVDSPLLNLIFNYKLFDFSMISSVIDRPSLRPSNWIPSNASISLGHEHVNEAVRKSQDGGVTLNFSKLDLTDINVETAEELATKLDSNGDALVER